MLKTRLKNVDNAKTYIYNIYKSKRVRDINNKEKENFER